jgi:hypothetical protein
MIALEHRKPDGRVAVSEKAADEALVIGNHPAPAAIAADSETHARMMRYLLECSLAHIRLPSTERQNEKAERRHADTQQSEQAQEHAEVFGAVIRLAEGQAAALGQRFGKMQEIDASHTSRHEITPFSVFGSS